MTEGTINLEKNKKIYIEFLGLGGSGKTSICNILTKELKNKYDAVSIQEEFRKRGRFYRHIIPVIYTIFRLRANTFKFLYYIWSNFKIEKQGILKIFFCNYWCTHIYSKTYILLSEEGFIKSELSTKKIWELLKFYPEDREKFFIFVDVPLDVAMERFGKKNLITNKKKGSQLKGKKLEKKKEYHSEIRKAFQLLKKQEGKMGIRKVIKIDGEKDFKENIKFLNEQLSKYIIP